MLPVAILCGGHGTRSGLPINKCFVDVNGKPFLLHQLELLEEQGHTEFVLCRGTDGTLAALRRAAPYLGIWFLIVYGDTYLPIDLTDFDREWARSGATCATAYYDGEDAGVSGIYRGALRAVGDDVTDFAVLRDRLYELGELYRYEAPTRWLEVGSPEGLALTRGALGCKT